MYLGTELRQLYKNTKQDTKELQEKYKNSIFLFYP
jgi:hypothetical protein